ncbi:MAG: NAD-dependent epimerase/dehydratase family protein [Acidobacteria bacterium]|nr:NAD-dependent epimerase/dehydratase family protein [Acidobacteriota bacterium]
MKNVFLTGATGYLGSAVAEKLKSRGFKVTGLARNPASAAQLEKKGAAAVLGELADLELLKNAAKGSDAVVHTAFDHSGDYSANAKLDRDAINAFGEALAGTDKPLVVTSTSAILADTRTIQADEDYPFDPASSRVLRGESERDIQQMSQKSVRAIALRFPLFIYGGGGSLFLPFMIEQAKKTGSANYIGRGDQIVSAIHVEDAAELFVAVLETSTAKGVYNAATESLTLKELNESIARLLHLKAKSITAERAREEFGPVYEFLSKSNQLSAEKVIRETEWSPSAFRKIEDDIENGSYRKFQEQ